MLTIKEIRHILANDYLVNETEQDVYFSAILEANGIIPNHSDPDCWEFFLNEIIKISPKQSSIKHTESIRANESRLLVEKREVKTEDKKSIDLRYVTAKGRKNTKINKARVSNSSVADVSTKAVITDLGDGYLFNLDRSYALHFISGSAYLIRKKIKQQEPVKLGYWLTLSPDYIFQTTINHQVLTLGEVNLLQQFFNQIKTVGDIPKLIDLRYYLQMTGISSDHQSSYIKRFNHTLADNNANIYATYQQWKNEKTNKGIRNFVDKARKNGIDVKNYYQTTDNGQMFNEDKLFAIWREYNYRK